MTQFSQSRSSRILAKVGDRLLSFEAYACCVLVIWALLNTLSDGCVADRLNLMGGALLSALMALCGFMLTARSFLVFKLHECVYSNEEYQAQAKWRADDNSAHPEVYHPLVVLDSKMGACLRYCGVSMVLVWIGTVTSSQAPLNGSFGLFHSMGLVMVQVEWNYVGHKAIADLSMASILVALMMVVAVAESMNRNFRSIIGHWQSQLDAKQHQAKIPPEK